MNISIMGDSISTFPRCNPEGYAVFYDASTARAVGLRGVRDTWWRRVCDRIGGTVVANDSFSGSCVAGDAFPAACGRERLDAIAPEGKSVDLVLVYMGVNDYGFAVPVGMHAGNQVQDGSRFFDAYRLMLRGIRNRCPNATIACGTIARGYVDGDPTLVARNENAIGAGLEEYNDAIRKAVGAEGALLADLAERKVTYESIDCVHPTRVGHATLAKLWLSCLYPDGAPVPED